MVLTNEQKIVIENGVKGAMAEMKKQK